MCLQVSEEEESVVVLWCAGKGRVAHDSRTEYALTHPNWSLINFLLVFGKTAADTF